jgi:small-conductance mechanosensitive channel
MTEANHRPAGRRWHTGHEEIVVAALFLVGMVFFRFRLDSFVIGREGSFAGPTFWPGVLLSIGIVLSAAYLVLAIIWSRRQGAEAASVPERSTAPTGAGGGAAATGAEPPAAAATAPEAEEAREGSVLKLVVGFVLLAAYIYLLAPIGFVPSTLLFSVGFLLLAGERRWYLLAGFPVVAVTVLLGVFTQLLTVSLPRGTGVFLTLSTYLY